jgi:hypothetical protein
MQQQARCAAQESARHRDLAGNAHGAAAFLLARDREENRIVTLRTFSFTGWSWSAVFVGAIVSLIFQVLLVMAGFGFGLLSIDVPAAESSPTAVSWAVFCWWAVSGVISAFAGGWAAANFSASFTPEGRAAHGLMAWALATLLVIAAAGLSASNSVAGDLAGPTVSAIGQYRTFENRGTTRPSQAQLEQARRNLALVMIGSFVALLVGAGAAVGGSQWLPEDAVRSTTFAEQRRS